MLNLLACDHSSKSPSAPEPINQCIPPSLPVTITPDYLSEHLERYPEVKEKCCCERELLAIKRFITRYITYLGQGEHADATSPATASSFLDSLTVAVPTKNKHASKIGAYLNFSKLLTRQQYGKLERMLEYKLAIVGLPAPKAVFPAYTSLTCPCCGCVDKQNRNPEDRSNFTCIDCQFHEHADIVGSINVAGKYLWLKRNKDKLKTPRPKHLEFNIWQAKHLQLNSETRLLLN